MLSLPLLPVYRFAVTPGLLGVQCFRNREKPGLQYQWKLIHNPRMPAKTARVSCVSKLIPRNLGLLLVGKLPAAKPRLKKA
jgi:hypothetical protein